VGLDICRLRTRNMSPACPAIYVVLYESHGTHIVVCGHSLSLFFLRKKNLRSHALGDCGSLLSLPCEAVQVSHACPPSMVAAELHGIMKTKTRVCRYAVA
jgi:hypothetical protein